MEFNEVILVNEQDEVLGSMEKIEAHEKGLLHRAFSIFIFNDQKELLLQQRAIGKYHSPGLWTNTCCSHPSPGESNEGAAHRRLQEEMGFDTLLLPAFQFTYKAAFDNGLTEHEFDHVFVGKYSSDPAPNPAEVMQYRFVSLTDIAAEMKTSPHWYTEWFKIAFPLLETYLATQTQPKSI